MNAEGAEVKTVWQTCECIGMVEHLTCIKQFEKTSIR